MFTIILLFLYRPNQLCQFDSYSDTSQSQSLIVHLYYHVSAYIDFFPLLEILIHRLTLKTAIASEAHEIDSSFWLGSCGLVFSFYAVFLVTCFVCVSIVFYYFVTALDILLLSSACFQSGTYIKNPVGNKLYSFSCVILDFKCLALFQCLFKIFMLTLN